MTASTQDTAMLDASPQTALPSPCGERILPHSHVLIVLPSGVQKILRVSPDTNISLGKFGSFPSNCLLHRPYNQTYDIVTSADNTVSLRLVPYAELDADIHGTALSAEDPDGSATPSSSVNPEIYDLPPGVMPTNQHTLDTSTSQTLTWQEIEELKNKTTNSGKDLVEKLLASHTAIDQKTPFSLHKYTLRKAGKFLRRFEVRKLDVNALVEYLPTVKEPYKFLDLRNEQLALMLSVGDIKFGGRYLVVDETGGLVVAALAERLGLLDTTLTSPMDESPSPTTDARKEPNTITLVHSNEQPNLSALTHFNFDLNTPPPTHPLTSHLHTLTWLQLLDPDSDTTLLPPPPPAPEAKPGKKATYNRKLHRWKKMMSIVNTARDGGYDSLIIAAHMAVPGILKALVPLVRPSGQVVVYCASLQQAAETADLYSSSRRAAAVQKKAEELERRQQKEEGTDDGEKEKTFLEMEETEIEHTDPTLLLAPTLHKVEARRYQVIPGRTHPMMTSRGGGEGYVVHATRVEPVQGRVDARGAFRSMKKRRVEVEVEGEGEGKKVKVGGEEGV
ncbi:Gcd10p-domain-containing protein [Ascodesmis nigricans]|uniref:tRNA (adenine(58)-N(1))-methyltransferase non-catalytic subunit TRM6 n=1 Tax=Ascodesmis nigricans TaxID=341454 RepID=A0A4V3SJN4_9PEZI|nr:Gcd10p-domain-containing protein [Ascodesmis nigricans]